MWSSVALADAVDHDHHDINTIVNSKTTGLPTHLISNFSKIDINLPSSIGSLYSLYFRSYSGDRNFDTLIYNDDNNDDVCNVSCCGVYCL